MNHCTSVVNGINWKLLREQKRYCMDQILGNPFSTGTVHEGIVHLLAEIQNAAVADGLATEDEVFGELT